MAKLPPRLILLALASVAVILFIALLLHGGEPRYHNQPLSFWTVRLSTGNQKEQAEAREALRAMGTSAVPSLVNTMLKQDSPLKLKLLKYARRFPNLYKWLRPNSDLSPAYAARALGEIGPSASNAIPALIQAQQEFNVFCPARAALMKIKGEQIGPLIQELDDFGPGQQQWFHAAGTLAEFGTNARAAIPALCRVINTTNIAGILFSVDALGRIHSDAKIVVPVLVDVLNRGASFNTSGAIFALGRFEGEARPAIPALRQHLQDADPFVRFSVIQNLAKILPPNELNTLVPALIQNANDPNPYLRESANRLLNQINPAAAAAKAGVK